MDDLSSALARRVRGEVRFDAGSRALYATDASNYRQVPIGVVVPRDVDDIVATMAVCRERGVPVLGRGAGTSLAGQCCNAAIIIDTSKHVRRILEIDPARETARVEPGLVLDALQKETHRHGLMFGPDPATHSRCTLGGMIGNDSCGVHSIMAGRTSDNVRSLEVLTYRGERLHVGAASEEELDGIVAAGDARGRIYGELRALRDQYAHLIRERYPKIPRRVSGYGLDQLLPENGFNVARALVGTESTCVFVLSAELRLIHWPRFRALLVVGYPNVYDAADAVPEIMGFAPIGLEGFDDRLVADARARRLNEEGLRLLPSGAGWLIAEFGGDSADEASERAARLQAHLQNKAEAPSALLLTDSQSQHFIWKVREAGLGSTAIVPGKTRTWEGWEDSAVPPERLGSYLRALRALLDRYGYRGDFYGHFGQGCVHTRNDFDLMSAPGIAKYRAYVEEAADIVVRHNGSLSGEHGDGQSRAELLPKMFGPELVEAFARFKAIWDPDGKMNPGKIVRPYRLDENLRLGAGYVARDLPTRFRFPEDDGRLSSVGLRCVGVGECRKVEGGTMCPSYRATLEEKHSTRGRAHLLFEMLQGEVIKDGWRDEHVKEALDLCLACKGCKRECPVSVDMASYKAEFLSHYYEGRLRPRHAYAFGWIDRWARLAAYAPRLLNALAHAPGLGRLAKAIAGIAPEREIPAFAAQTFTGRFCERRAGSADGSRVMLWPDTFNDHFRPEILDAAVQVIEAAGHVVVLPAQPVCCGRPLYDYGMLDAARQYLSRVLDVLGPQIADGTAVVVLEPSCAAVFRDELRSLFAGDERARRLSEQVVTFGEWLQQARDRLPNLRLSGPAVLHQHCHQKAVLSTECDVAFLRALGLELEVLDSGCCGMAGAFGFERAHYGVSMTIGEKVLLPAVRRQSAETLIVSDGFSCREQIVHGTSRRALHLAEVAAKALEATGSQQVTAARRVK